MALYRVTTSYFCCGIEVDRRGVVCEAAPIMRWAVGKPIGDVTAWVQRKGGTIENLDAATTQASS